MHTLYQQENSHTLYQQENSGHLGEKLVNICLNREPQSYSIHDSNHFHGQLYRQGYRHGYL